MQILCQKYRLKISKNHRRAITTLQHQKTRQKPRKTIKKHSKIEKTTQKTKKSSKKPRFNPKKIDHYAELFNILQGRLIPKNTPKIPIYKPTHIR